MSRYLLLALTAVTLASGLPRHGGYVNDFAGKLAPAEQDALEGRLRDYERATSNEVAVAIVESLEGQSVEEYARQLFHEWGLGKRDRNNGVLLLWAPAERKVRIQVGYGLEGTLSDSAAAEILRGVTDAFRREDYAGGLNAGVDGIIARLGGDEGGQPKSGAPPLVVIGVAGLFAAGMVLLLRAARRRQLATALPGELARAGQSLQETETLRRNAVPALEELRREAPAEVWQEFNGLAESAPGELAQLRADLDAIQLLPRQSLRELSLAHRAVKRWGVRCASLWQRLDAAGRRLDAFRSCRERAPAMLRELGDALAQRGPGGGWTQSGKLVAAAAETYARAQSAAAANPANWLLVYDLLNDTADCLDCADNPGRYQARERYWTDSGGYSPAYALLLMQLAATSSASGSGYDGGDDSGGGFGGGDSGAGFGGGDSGGGGASSDY